MSSSVRFPMAETTTTTSSPAPTRPATCPATCRMRSASATDVPPNFCTTRIDQRMRQRALKREGDGGRTRAGLA